MLFTMLENMLVEDACLTLCIDVKFGKPIFSILIFLNIQAGFIWFTGIWLLGWKEVSDSMDWNDAVSRLQESP